MSHSGNWAGKLPILCREAYKPAIESKRPTNGNRAIVAEKTESFFGQAV